MAEAPVLVDAVDVSPADPPTHRYKVRADGRCAIRATLYAAGVRSPDGVGNILVDNSHAARNYLRQTRIDAAAELVERMDSDEEFACAVRWSFPDEEYETFESWLEAQRSDDSELMTSNLWCGGGQWTLYGLGLLLRVQITIHTVDSATLELVPGTEMGTMLVDARKESTGAGASNASRANDNPVRLASMRADDGTYDHFDVLVAADAAGEGAEPLGLQSRPECSVTHPPPMSSQNGDSKHQTMQPSALVGWAALYVVAVAVCLSLPPIASDGSVWLRVARMLVEVSGINTRSGDSWSLDPASRYLSSAVRIPVHEVDMPQMPPVTSVLVAH